MCRHLLFNKSMMKKELHITTKNRKKEIKYFLIQQYVNLNGSEKKIK